MGEVLQNCDWRSGTTCVETLPDTEVVGRLVPQDEKLRMRAGHKIGGSWIEGRLFSGFQLKSHIEKINKICLEYKQPKQFH